MKQSSIRVSLLRALLFTVLTNVCFAVLVQAQTRPFITTWSIPADDLELTIPLVGTDFSIDWGDGTVETGLTATNPNTTLINFIHTYANPGNYTVSVNVNLDRIIMRNSDDAIDLLSVEQWGDVPWTSMQDAFFRCPNVVINAGDRPDLTLVNSTSFMFLDAASMNQPIGDWDMSNVQLMTGMFQGASSFNQDIGGWDVSQVADFRNVFSDAVAFDQDIGSWNVGNGSSMRSMFWGATAFNKDIRSWNVSNVTEMHTMFREARAFNQNINSWDVSNVTDMSGMFNEAISFNQPLDSWNVGNVTTMSAMFRSARAFNQDLNSWDVSNVTDTGAMFLTAIAFNGKVDAWDVSNISTMGTMFSNAHSFNQPIGVWQTSSMTNIVAMFSGAQSFNQDIGSWDVSQVTNFRNTFSGAVVFNQDLSSWDVGNATRMGGMFFNAAAFNRDLSNWDVSNVTEMDRVFMIAGAFDQDLGSWDVSQVTDMSDMLRDAGLSEQNYDNTLIGWASQAGLQSNVPLGARNLEYCNGAIARQNLIDTYGWSIIEDSQNCALTFTSASSTIVAENTVGIVLDVDANNGGADDAGITYILASGGDNALCIIDFNSGEISFLNGPDFENPLDANQDNIYNLEVIASDGITSLSQLITVTVTDVPETRSFITTWSIPADDLELTLPLIGTNFSIDWGDGTVETGLTALDPSNNFNNFVHTYTSPGSYTVSISIELDRIIMRTSDDASDLLSVEQWGDVSWTSMENAFYRCTNVVINASDAPDLSSTNNTSFMFWEAALMNQPIGDWDMSNVELMAGMFQGASSFNQDIGGWDMSKVTRTTNMFVNAAVFNQDIGAWNLASNTSTSRMFEGATVFNQDIGSWNMSSVTDISNMFKEARAFNQDISQWDVSNVSDMRGMFRTAVAFNQPLDSWDVSSVTLMTQMFRNARAFNQDLNTWDVSNVTDMATMFQSTQVFNGKIDAWDVRNVAGMGLMFNNAQVFNQPIGVWETNSLTNMVTMFSGALVFDQDISSWDVSNVTRMGNMFFNAAAFNQDLSNWDVSNVTQMDRMFMIAAAFDQDLGSWDVSQVTDMTDMLRDAGLSEQNYDNTLIGWAGVPSLQSNVPLGARNLQYCAGTIARQSLIDTYGWNIIEDSQNCTLTFTSAPTTTLAENTVGIVLDVNANNGGADDAGITYTLVSGGDNDLCSIDWNSGQITFLNTPDFENPSDADQDNIYNLEVVASDGTASLSQSITITVTDVPENADPVFTSTPITSVNDNESYTYGITTMDSDGDDLSLTATTIPDWLDLVASTGNVTTTFAGTGASSFVNGNGTSATFSFPAGVAVDNDGNVFVADQGNHVIRKITPSGDVSTFCGSGIQGFADGAAGVARFDNPKDLAFDNDGNLILADIRNHRIRKIAPDGTVTTVAGSGARGFVNANGTNAVFDFPAGVAVDPAGNIFVADQDNQRIRKITPAGDVSTFAGSGIEGFADGPANVARFDDLKDLVFDREGNLIVADLGNSRVRKVSPDGTVSTLAGSGAFGFADGNGTNAVFNFPAGVVLDPFGNICVADQDNHRIRVISPSGDVTTFAGSGAEGFADGAPGTARFNDLKDLAFDRQGNLYVADFENHRIRKLSGNGFVLTGDATGQPAGDYPVVLEANDGNGGVVAQSFTVTVVDVTAPVFTSPTTASIVENTTGTAYTCVATDVSGSITFALGSANDESLFNINPVTGEVSFIISPDFESPTDGDANNIYLIECTATDGLNTSSILVSISITDVFENIDPVFTSTPITSVNDDESYNYTITTIDGNGDNLSVTATTIPDWLELVASTGNITTTFAGTGASSFVNGNGTSATFSFPAGVAVDNDGNVFVADQGNHVIRKITPSGDVSTFCGSGIQGFADGAAGVARFDNPKDLAFDNDGNLILADIRNHRIRKIAPDGTVTTVAGSGARGFVNANGTNAVFDFPAGVAVDPAGNIFVADQDNQRIRKITPAGDVSTFAGSGIEGFADGPANVARFDDLKDLVFDREGNLIVADLGNSRVRKVSPDGTVSTLAGSGAFGFADGNGTNAVFNFPAGVVLDPFGNICVADQDNHRIRVISPSVDVTTFAGSGIEGFADGGPSIARFDDIKDLAFDNQGNLYVADFENNRIRKLSGNGFVLTGDATGQPAGDYPVVLEANDGNGGIVTQNFIITIGDVTPPTVITQNITVELDASGNAVISGADIDNGSSDTNGIESLIVSQTDFSCDDIGGIPANDFSLNFDGDDQVIVPDTPELRITGDMTIEAWFKADEFDEDWVRVAGKGAPTQRNYALWYKPNGIFLFQQYGTNGDNVDAGYLAPINTGEWYHIAGVREGNVGKLYVNGQLVATDQGGIPVTEDSPFRIGYGETHTYHRGQIDEVRLWNIAKTDQEIADGFNKVLNGSEAGLLAYYNMEQGEGTPVEDKTGNGFSGELNGFTQASVYAPANTNLVGGNGATEVTLTVTDGQGVSATGTALVTVEDNLPPLVVTQNIAIDLDASGYAVITPDQIDNGSSDNCRIERLSLSQTTFDCGNVGVNTVTLTVRDASGNESTAMATVTVGDVTAPGGAAIPAGLPAAPQLALDNITEAAGYGLLYQLDIPERASWTSGVPYAIDNSGLAGLSFDRVAYLMELDDQWVWVSMDAFSADPAQVGLPQVNEAGRSFSYQQSVSNLSVEASANSGVTNRQNITTGNVEIWNYNYVQLDGVDVPNADRTIYDWGDQVSTLGNYSSFQVHDYGEQEVLLAYNRWGVGGISDIGIGNNTNNEHRDYTFERNADQYAVRRLYVLVGNAAQTGSGAVLTNDITLSLDANGQASITVAQIDGGNVDACGINSASLDLSSFNCDDLGENTVTLTLTDVHGNESTGTATVTVTDSILPVIALQGAATIDLDQGTAFVDPGATVSDNCNASLVIGGDVVDINTAGTYIITYNVTDGSGNQAEELTRTVNIIDNISPVINANDITVNNDPGECSAFISSYAVTASDQSGIASIIFDIPEGSVFASGTTVVTVTATDANGNTADTSFNVTVNDTEAPQVFAQNIALFLDENGQASLPALSPQEVIFNEDFNSDSPFLNATSLNNWNVTQGNVDVFLPNQFGLPFNTNSLELAGNTNGAIETKTAIQFEPGEYLLSFDLLGNNGNAAIGIDVGSLLGASITDFTGAIETRTFNFTVTQSASATIRLNEFGGDNPSSGTLIGNVQVIRLAEGVLLTSSDNCAVASVVASQTDFTCADLGLNTITLTVTDASGNEGTATARVEIIDNIDPNVLITGNILLVHSAFTPYVDSGASALDNCAASISTVNPINVNVPGTYQITYTATDPAGNIDEAIRTVIVQDSVSPVLTAADLVFDNDPGDCSAIVSSYGVTATDDSQTVDIIFDIPEGSVFTVGTTLVTATATDPSGNTATGSFNVTVNDTEAPQVFAQNIALFLDENGEASLPALNPQEVIFSEDFNSDSPFLNTTSLNNWNVTQGNVDVFSPNQFGLPFNTNSLELAGNTNGAIETKATIQFEPGEYLLSFDLLGNNGDAAIGIDIGSLLGASITDFTGSIETRTFNFTVTQSVSATIRLNEFGGDDPSSGTLIGNVQVIRLAEGVLLTSSDNCAVASVMASQTDFTCADLGLNTITLTVTDASDNEGTATAQVEIIDNIDPTVVGQDVSVTLNALGIASITLQDVVVNSADNCEVSLSLGQDTFGVADALNSPVTIQLTGTDPSGNTTTVPIQVTVIDPVPVAICQDIIVDLGVDGTVNITPDQVDGGSSSLLGIASLSLDQSTFTCADLGLNTVTLTVTSTSGSSTTCQATVTVRDVTAPQVLVQSINLDLVNGEATLTPEMINAGSTDACGIQSLSLDRDSFTCADVGDQTVMLTVMDVNGNSAMASATVTVRDVTAPQVLVQSINLDLVNGEATLTPEMINAGSTDACGIQSLSLDRDSFTCADVGDQTVILTVTDVNENSAMASATVTVRDVTAPNVLIQNIQVDLDEAGNVTISPTDIDAGSSDLCGIGNISLDRTAFGCEDVGINTVELTVTDIHGNSSAALATVTVSDVTAPTLELSDITLTLDAVGQAVLPSLTGQEVVFFDDFSSDEPALTKTELSRWNVLDGDVDVFFPNQFGLPFSSNALDLAGDLNGTIESKEIFAFEPGEYRLTFTVLGNNGDARLGLDIGTLFGTSFTDFSGVIETKAVDFTVMASANATIRFNEFGDEPFFSGTTLDNIKLSRLGNGIVAYADDACGIATIVVSQQVFDCSDIGDNIVTVTATDTHGNGTMASVTVTIEDNDAPNVLVNNITLSLGEDGMATITANDLDGGTTDNCDFTLSIDKDTFDCSSIGESTITLTATDSQGNTASAQALVTVVDDLGPVITATDIELQLDENGMGSINPDDVTVLISDNCGVASTSISQTDFGCENLGDNAVTVTATDVNGNVTTGAITVRVIDIIPPVVVTRDITVELGESGSAAINPEDVLILSEEDLQTSEDCEVSAAEHHAVWLSKYVKAGFGKNKGSYRGKGKKKGHYTQTKDARFVFDADGGAMARNLDGTATVTGVLINTEDVNDKWEVALNLRDGRNWAEWSALGRSYKDEKRLAGQRFRDWTYYEMAEGSQLIGMGENAGEVIALSHAPVDYRYGFQLGEAANSKNGNFGLSGWFFYTNRAGNQVQGDFNLDVTDCSNQPSPQGDLLTTDNCSINTISLNQSTFSCSDLGTNTIEVTVTDQSGNATTEVATVTVTDSHGPVAVARDITVSLGVDGTVIVDPSLLNGGSTDNCDIVSYSLSKDTFDCSDIESDRGGSGYYNWWKKKRGRKGHKVALTVTDAAGNTDTAEAYVTVVDDQAPEISPEPITLVAYGRHKATLGKRDIYPLVSDNCEVKSIWFPRTRFYRRDAGMNTVTVKATDASGNSTTGLVNVNVIDLSSYGKRIAVCYNGQTREVNRNHVQYWIRRGASLGTCSTDITMTTGGSTLRQPETLQTPLIELKAYPNPSEYMTTITFSSEVAGVARMAVTNASGIMVAELFEGELVANKQMKVSYETSELPGGIYIIRLVTAGEVRTLKLIVRK